jgi:hypothetical protein
MLKVGRLKDMARVEMFLTQEAVSWKPSRRSIERHGLSAKWAELREEILT